MEHEVNLFSPPACWYKMKDKSVEDVFRETPDDQPEYEKRENINKPQAFLHSLVSHVSDNREIDYCGN